MDCSSFCVAFERRRTENGIGWQADGRFDHDKAGGWQAQGRDLLADTFDPGMAAAEEKWNIRAEAERYGLQLAGGLIPAASRR